MRDHFKFSIAYLAYLLWATIRSIRTRNTKFCLGSTSDAVQAAKDKADAAFEFTTKMGFGYYRFHDYDLIREGATFAESESRLATITDYLKEKQAASGVKLLWGTAKCFFEPSVQ